MNKRLTVILLFLVTFASLYSQTYKTKALSDEIHTILVTANDDWRQAPVVELNSSDFIQIEFDRISENSLDRLRYRLVHCNADWTRSSLSEIEFLDGFSDNLIDDYGTSMNTTIEYTNFRLAIPNNDVRLKVSGNYAVEIYEEDNVDNILLTACFSTFDNKIGISGSVTSNTLIDAHREHQQISFTLDHKHVNIQDPFSDLKIFVRQNDRFDNQKSNLKPTFVQPNKLIYDQNRELIFEAGNEYRRFDMPSYKYNGLHIDHIEYRRPYYYVTVIPDKIRFNTRYIYDEDQNGKFFVRNAEGNDNSVDADYFFVYLSLEADESFIENIYINGNFTHDTFDDRYLMKHDANRKEYSASLFLKQGVYNYQYLADLGAKKYSTSLVEGNYSQTENQYTIWVYHRPIGQRYDSLIGFLKIGK